MHIDGDRIVSPPDEVDDLRRRLAGTRWPSEPWDGGPFAVGSAQLADFCSWWATGFDWPSAIERINRGSHRIVEVGGVAIHAVLHGADRSGLPVLLLHGWPSTFLEFERLVPLLLDSSACGPVVTASPPGYGLSPRPTTWTTRRSAGAMVEAMARLGHPRFLAHGTDWGSAIAAWIALDHPDAVVGIHLSNLDLDPAGPLDDLTPDESAYRRASEGWWAEEGGYKDIQSTRPEALATLLSDSPAGMAGWILDRWAAWTDPALGDRLEDRVGREALAETLTWLWLTNSAASSIHDYRDNRVAGTDAVPAGRRVAVPTALARFARVGALREDPPRSWVERMYRLERWEPMERGGHFAALEAPDLLAADLTAFLGSVTDPG